MLSSPRSSHSPTSYSSPTARPAQSQLRNPRPSGNSFSPRTFPKPSSSSIPSPSASSQPNGEPSPRPSSDRPVYVSEGTQYTPPDFPPTSVKSSLYVNKATASLSHVQITKPSSPEPAGTSSATLASEQAPVPPPEPRLRVTPKSQLQDASSAAGRRKTSANGENSPSVPDVASKRTKQEDNKTHLVPADYSKCGAKILASLIADMLMELIRHNDDIPTNDKGLTRFHSRAPPTISVHDYLARLTFHATLTPPILLSMIFYIDRLCGLYPAFTINSLTVHRFLITAATVAAKGLSDTFWTNSTYARVGGVTVKELALLELELLIRCEWRIVPTPESLVDYYKSLVHRSKDWALEGEEESESDDLSGKTTTESSQSKEPIIPKEAMVKDD